MLYFRINEKFLGDDLFSKIWVIVSDIWLYVYRQNELKKRAIS
jgi:hypothetical protein